MDKPSLPKGTRDFGPAQMAKRQFIMEGIRAVFQKYGFMPLETPAMENISTLTGKYGDEGDQLLFKVLNSGDFLKDVGAGELEARNSKQIATAIADKGLRYDLTVPFARYAVMNRHEISLPFKRYQMQPVWRADRPQKGRYREFYQCDADVVGTDSLICEAEIILMITEIFQALNIGDYTIKINHRGILSGLADASGAMDESALFVGIDKLDKIGEDKVRDELYGKGFDTKHVDTVFSVLNFKGNAKQKFDFLKGQFTQSKAGQKGLDDLKEVFDLLNAYGLNSDHIDFDLSLARGLSYYTGCIFEVKVNGVAIGSVSGGGRYDNLTQAFGSKEKLSGVGISFGIDRLYDAMEELKAFPTDTTQSTTVLICHLDKPSLTHGLGVLKSLRTRGIASEIYPDLKKLDKQLDYANNKQIPFAIIIGSNEVTSGQYSLKDLRKGEQLTLGVDGIVAHLANNQHLQPKARS
jgi:histidyl-tRNA synthetase